MGPSSVSAAHESLLCAKNGHSRKFVLHKKIDTELVQKGDSK